MQRKMIILLVCLLSQMENFALAATDSLPVRSGEALKLLRVTPQGENVPAGQQIVFQFDRPVVPVGRMERAASDIPVTISPTLNCEWRWLNTSALACQLKQADMMKLATTYQLVISPGITTEAGETLEQSVNHQFTTLRPQTTYTRFRHWYSPADPLLQVTFNQPVTRKSVQSALYFVDEQNNSAAIPVQSYPDNHPRVTFWQQTGDESSSDSPSTLQNHYQSVGDLQEETRRIWYIEPLGELPENQQILLKVRPGLISSEGPVQGVEARTVVSFDTYPAFQFVGIRCTPKGQREQQTLRYTNNPGVNSAANAPVMQGPQQGCAPLKPVALVFTAPVLNSVVKNFVTLTPRLDSGRSDYDPWANSQDWSSLDSPHRQGRHYFVWLPELLQANQAYQLQMAGDEVVDEFGRKLGVDIDFRFNTAHREPRLFLQHKVAVLEKDVDSEVPLMVTNLNSVEVQYQRLTPQQKQQHLSRSVVIPEVQDTAFTYPLGAREMVDDVSGAVFGQLSPNPLPPDYWRSEEIFLQVSPFQVHAKFGHFNSLVWVTRFADGTPVEDAEVTLFKGSYQGLTEMAELGYSTQTDDSGRATLPGTEVIDPLLQMINSWEEKPRLFVKVQQGEDMALLPLDYSFKVSGTGVYPWLQTKGQHSYSWGTTAQGVYRLGDTVEFKVYVREQSNRHWIAAPRDGYTLTVKDPQDKTVLQMDNVELSEFGALHGDFPLPEQGAVGWYQFVLERQQMVAGLQQKYRWQPMSVLVSDFTPSPFKVRTELNGELFAAGDTMTSATLAELHSGGPYAEAAVRVIARLDNSQFSPNHPGLKNFTFGSINPALRTPRQTLADARASLDGQGEYQHSLTLPDIDIYYGHIFLESAVQDERGKNVVATTSAKYAGRDRFVGLRNTQWVYQQGSEAGIDVVVADVKGNIVPDLPVTVSVQVMEYKASRVKGPGNAYLTRNIAEWVEQSQCLVVTGQQAQRCQFTPEKPGYYQFVAQITDTRGRAQITSINGWVSGSGNVLWDLSNDATLQIVPEQNGVNVGDTVRYLVKNPFPGAQALVTVERYGVIDSWVQTLETSTPIIEVTVKPDYLPGFYLSVMVVSPRVEQPLGPGKVDLGKPAYRLGYVATTVKDPYKEIAVDVTTNKKVYKPREKVQVSIHAAPRHSQGTENNSNDNRDGAESIELAVAVVDESVLALNRQGTDYYDPYQGFNHLDALDLENYSLVSRLVGRQKFEKKGANPGGDGGGLNGSIRNVFKYVSYWNPSLIPDDHGNASIEFAVPDNLTGWRVLVIGVTPTDRMGLGQSNFKVNRPTELRPVMPNQVIEGDRFEAGFSLMNRTGEARELQVKVNVSGPLAEASATLLQQTLKLQPYQRQTLYFPVTTKGDGELQWLVTAKDAIDADAIEHKLPVNKRSSLEVAATYGTTTSETITENFAIPEGIRSDVGAVSAVLFPSVIGNVDGAFRYVQDYPYGCWEQRLTKAVMASSFLRLQDYFQKNITWEGARELVLKTLAAAANFQAPDGGMSYWVPNNQYVSPYLSAYTALALQWLRRDGYAIPEPVEQRLHHYLQRLLREDVFPTFYNKGMAASVRAVALAALAQSGSIDAADVERYQSHFGQMDLFGKAHYLQAAILTGTNSSITQQALDNILGHASQSGGKIQFNEVWDDSYKYLLATPLRANCGILSSLLKARSDDSLTESVKDIPIKLVRSITQTRGRREHWENTQENVFCANALIDYSGHYETVTPDFIANVSFAGESLGEASFTEKSAPAITLSRPLRADDPGRKSTMTIHKTGPGRLYYSARLAYDLLEDNAQRINSGIEIRREYSVERGRGFELLTSPVTVSQGALVKVDLFVRVPAARHFVVVNDPLPGGLEPVNTQLATASVIDAEKGVYQAAAGSYFFEFNDWSNYGRYFRSFYHQELRHDSARFYADYLPAGNYHLAYTAQAIAPGEFTVLPVHAEEMYDPDIYGKGLPATLRVVLAAEKNPLGNDDDNETSTANGNQQP